MKPTKRLIVPVFLPQAGCRHTCIFCNQTSLTGYEYVPGPEEAGRELAKHLGPKTPDATVAFYGGSFTALDTDMQIAYLKVAAGLIEKKHAGGIRLSTRPDAIDSGLVRMLKENHVSEVELGVQSMDDGVLMKTCRGHTSRDVENAVGLLKAAGISVGVQMMAGLPWDSRHGFMESIKRVISLKPDFARIFPTIVVEGAPLAKLWRRGEYVPPGLEEAVSMCADALLFFEEAGISVIKLGLQPTKWLDEAYLSGAYHPSFGHMVESERAFRRMRESLDSRDAARVAEFRVNPRELSVYIGISGDNLVRLKEHYGGLDVSIVQDGEVGHGELRLVTA